MTARQRRRFLLLVIATLLSLGCIAVYSTTAIQASEVYGRSLHFVANHLVAIGIGLGLDRQSICMYFRF
jgi:cell division protein FtsW (lipid II flippase)